MKPDVLVRTDGANPAGLRRQYRGLVDLEDTTTYTIGIGPQVHGKLVGTLPHSSMEPDHRRQCVARWRPMMAARAFSCRDLHQGQYEDHHRHQLFQAGRSESLAGWHRSRIWATAMPGHRHPGSATASDPI